MSLVQRQLPGPKPYDALYGGFKWTVPERYNIARQVCDRWAEAQPDRIAILHKTMAGPIEHISYGTLRDSANRLANGFAANGIQKRDRIALLLPQSPQTAITHIAAYKLGAVAVPLASLFGPDALEYRLNTSGAKAIVTDAAGLAKIKGIRDRLPELELVLCVAGADGEAKGFDAFCADHGTDFETLDTSPDDWAIMVFTSDSTNAYAGSLSTRSRWSR